MANFNHTPAHILAKANDAAIMAARDYLARKPGPLCCGRAVVELRRGTKFARHAIETKQARETYPSGVWLSVPRFDAGDACQNIDLYEVMARAMANELNSFGVKATVHSWVD